jgi:hypothetical protein
MAKRTIDADAILNRAKPLAHQHALEIQPFGHLAIPTTNLRSTDLEDS